jgi:hypothetical protein
MYHLLLFHILTAIPDLQHKFITLASTKEKRSELSEKNTEVLKHFLASAIENQGQQQFTCFIGALRKYKEDQVRDRVEFLERLRQVIPLYRIEFYAYLLSRPIGILVLEPHATCYRRLRELYLQY